MAEKKTIFRIQLEESPTLAKLGFENIKKAIPGNDSITSQELMESLHKLLEKGFSDERKSELRMELGEFQFVEKVDGRVVRRFEEKDVLMDQRTEPPKLYYTKKKSKRVLKTGSNLRRSFNPIKAKKIDSVGSLQVSGRGDSLGSLSLSSSSSSLGRSLSDKEKSGLNLSTDSVFSTVSSKSPEFFAGREPTQDDILLQNILKEVLGCMGVSSEGVDSLVTAAIQMGWENTGKTVADYQLCESLETMRDAYINPGLKRLGDIRQIVVAQRFIRTFIARKRLLKFRHDFLPSTPGGELPILGKRLDVYRKMKKSEASFKEKMYFSYSKVERAMEKLTETEGWILGTECALFFGASSVFRTFYSTLNKKMISLTERWPSLDWIEVANSISSLFVGSSEIFLNFALKYVHICSKLESLLMRPETNAFVATLHHEIMHYQSPSLKDPKQFCLYGKSVSLYQLIMDPMYRVRAYVKFFTEVLEFTPSESRERPHLEAALEKLTSLNEKIEEKKVASKNQLRKSEVLMKFNAVAGLDLGSYNYLTGENRGFVHETIVHLIQKEKEKWRSREMVVMLFSDLALVASKLEKSGVKSEKSLLLDEHGVVPMCMTSIQDSVDIGDGRFPPDCVLKAIIETGKDTKNELLFGFKNSAEKGSFLKQLSPLMRANQLCFRRPIPEVLKSDGATSVPVVVRRCIETLYFNNAHLLEGIFRIAGETKYLNQMKAMCNRWKKGDPVLDLSGFESFDVASLLKLWFRELPEPIMTYAVFDKYVMDNDEDVDCQELLKALPEKNRAILLAVMCFNVELTKYSEQNKMTPANVSICWGPTILRPEHENMNTQMRMPRVNKIVEDLVAWFAENPQLLPKLPIKKKQKMKRWTSAMLVSGRDTNSEDGNDQVPSPRRALTPGSKRLGLGLGSRSVSCMFRESALEKEKEKMVPPPPIPVLPPPPPMNGRGPLPPVIQGLPKVSSFPPPSNCVSPGLPPPPPSALDRKATPVLPGQLPPPPPVLSSPRPGVLSPNSSPNPSPIPPIMSPPPPALSPEILSSPRPPVLSSPHIMSSPRPPALSPDMLSSPPPPSISSPPPPSISSPPPPSISSPPPAALSSPPPAALSSP